MPQAPNQGPDIGGQTRFRLLPALALFAIAFVALSWPWLSGRVTIPWDAKAQFHPQLQFLAASLARGESPFWTPFVFAGWPQIADPQSLIFSPLHFALAALTPDPSFRADDAVTFAYLFLGGVGVILFFRDRGWHVAGALVAALMFAFGGSAASRLQHTGQIMSLAYLAMALWLIARTLSRRSWRTGLVAGIVAGLLATERDQVAMLSLYLLAGYVLAYWLQSGHPLRSLRETVVPIAAVALAAFIVAAVPLTMTALLAADSNRPAIDFLDAGRGSLHPANLMMLVFGNLYGASIPNVDFWGPPSFPWKAAFGDLDLAIAQNVGQIYAGILAPVSVVGCGMLRGWLWSREVRFFSIALVLVLFYALGRYTPAFTAMYEWIPGVTLFRRPADATFVLGFVLAIAVGFLVHLRLGADVAAASRRQNVIAAAIACTLVATALALALTVGALETALPPVLIGVASAGAAIAALTVARRVAARSALAAATVLVGFVAADLGWNNGPNVSTGLPPAMYDALRRDTANETVTLLKKRLAETNGPDRRGRVELIGIAYHWPNLSLAHGLEHLFGQNPLRLRDFALATGVGDTVAVPDQRSFAPLFPSYRSVFANLLGLRLIATGVPVEQIDRNLRPGDLALLAHTKDAYVYENPRALPRVMFVPDFRIVDFEQLLHTGWPADVDPRETLLLDRAPPATGDAIPAGEGTARIVSYANTEVVVEVESRHAGFLLFNDVWHPWWYADVDAAPAEILRANVIFRAIALQPGRHRVRFVFRPFRGAWDQLRRKLSAR